MTEQKYVKNFILKVCSDSSDNSEGNPDFCLIRFTEEDLDRYRKFFVAYQQTASTLGEKESQLLTLEWNNSDPLFFYTPLGLEYDICDISEDLTSDLGTCDDECWARITNSEAEEIEAFARNRPEEETLTKAPQSCIIHIGNGHLRWEAKFNRYGESCITGDLYANRLFDIPRKMSVDQYFRTTGKEKTNGNL